MVQALGFSLGDKTLDLVIIDLCEVVSISDIFSGLIISTRKMLVQERDYGVVVGGTEPDIQDE